MMVSSRAQLLRPLGTALAVAVVVALAPGRAAAECGDYVHILNDRSDAPPAGAPESPRKPCHGPGCSNQPASPVPLSAPAAPPADPKEGAARATDSPRDDDRTGWHLPSSPDAVPEHVPQPIFHPPRA
jgi:hypothetical protein